MNYRQSRIILVFIMSILLILPIFNLITPSTSNLGGINANSGGIVLRSSAWAPNGTAICTASHDQYTPWGEGVVPLLQLCTDGGGGAIIAWADFRSGTNYDIYAQRINAAGAIQWPANGTAICTANNDQKELQLCPDGAGGAIITWADNRSGVYYDIYAQRINAAGVVQWTVDGVAICTATNIQDVPQLCTDGAGGAIIAWADLRNGVNYDIYAQRINATGAVNWTANGVAISTVTQQQEGVQLCTDGAGGAIITWQDLRDWANWDIFAQHIAANGTTLWTANGIAICVYSDFQANPQLCPDGAGGAIITWQDCRSGSFPDGLDIYAQRINATGAVNWTANGVAICTRSATDEGILLCTDGAGGAIMTWVNRGTNEICTQRINATGVVQWIANGVAIGNSCWGPQLCPDGAGGAIITWKDSRNLIGGIWSQQINAAGVAQWIANGTVICNAIDDQRNPQICIDEAGDAIITWQDHRSGIYWDIYARKVEVIPPGNFSIYSPIGWAKNQTPTIICKFLEGVSGVNVSTVEFAYSTTGLTTPTNWAPVNGTYKDAACSIPAADGDTGWFYARVLSVPFNQESVSQNTIRFRATDIKNQNGTQETAFIIPIDGSIQAPIGVLTWPSGWFKWPVNVNWTNPADVSGIVGVYYKNDSAPVSNTDGTYVAGLGINKIPGMFIPIDCAHIVYLWLVDAAGNVDFHKNSTTYLYYDHIIDAPIGALASPSGWTDVNSFNITWTNPADVSGIAAVRYKVDQEPFFNNDGMYRAGAGINNLTGITLPSSGVHTVYLWLVDAAGNVDYHKNKTVTLYLDNTVDSPINVLASPSSWTEVNFFNITWTNPADISGIVGVYYKFDSQPTSDTDGTYVAGPGINNLTGITVPGGDGTHSMYIWLVDGLGNIDRNHCGMTNLYLKAASQSIPFPSSIMILIMGLIAAIFYRYTISKKANFKKN